MPIPLAAQHDRPVLGDSVSFGPFTLALTARLLERDGEPVSLGGRAFDILAALVARAGEVVDKRDLIAAVWPNITVDEGSLRVHMVSLRKALSEGEAGARYIANVPGRGYCWVAPLGAANALPVASEAAAAAAATDLSPVPPPVANAASAALPSLLARMVGREETITSLVQDLETHRFVTIVGPGGIGKTTVAVALAHALKNSFDGGAYFVDLAGLTDRHLVAGLVTSAVGVQAHTDDPLAPLVARFQDRRALLVLDNCEHVVETVADLTERLWREAPGLHLLATSREPLRVEGEFVHRLPGLPCPPTDEIVDVARLRDFPAAQLFVERAAAGGQALTLTDEEAGLVAGICKKLDGIALAIELAAGRVDAYGIAGLAALLDKRLNLLWHGRRTAVARQQTMSATIGWSYNLLTEDERQIARRLSVFAGPFSLQAAQEVAAEDEMARPSVVDAVAELVAKSLLSTEAGATRRYRFLETTKAYLAERLAESGEAASAARAHARLMIDRLAAPPPAPAEAGRELADLQAALDWAFSPMGDPDIATTLAAVATGRFLHMGLLVDCREWSLRALAILPQAAEGTRRELDLRAALGLSWMYTLGNGEDVSAAFSRGLELAQALGDDDYQLRLLSALHTYLTRRADFRGALDAARRADAVAARLGPAAPPAMAESMQALSLHLLAQHDEAEALYDKGRLAVGVSPREEMVRFGFPHHMTCLVGWARALALSGRPQEGRRQLLDALALAETLDHPVALCVTSIWGAPILTWSGDWEMAEAVVRRFSTVAEQHALAPHVAAGLGLLGEIYVRRGQAEAGVPLLQSSLSTLESERHALLKTPLTIALALGLSGLGRHDLALETLADAETGMEVRGDLIHAPDLLRIRGEILLARDPVALETAEAAFRIALDRAADHKLLAFRLKAANALADLLRRQDRAAEIPSLLGPLVEAVRDGYDLPDHQTARGFLDAALARA